MSIPFVIDNQQHRLSDALADRLRPGLTQVLGHLNGYTRSTKAGRRAGVNLCLFPGVKHITINEGRVQEEE